MLDDAVSPDCSEAWFDEVLWGTRYDARELPEAALSGQGLLRVDFPCNLEIVHFDDDEEIHGFYMKCAESWIRPISPDLCIDPRYFYDDYKDVKERVEEVLRETSEDKRHYDCTSQIKPPLSYAQIITQAIRTSATGKLTLSEIYKWIEDGFEYYRHANPVWKNSIRHNLSLNKCFKKVPRDPGTRGKGGKWMLDYEFLMKEESKKRRRMQQCDAGRDKHASSKPMDASGDCSTDEREDGFCDAFDRVSPESLMRQMERFIASKISSSKNVNKV